MLRKRVIPVLLLQEDELFKTVQFGQPRYVGDPINAVRIFNEKEVDEIMLLDIGLSRIGTLDNAPNFELLHEISSESFVPLCYGGGVNDFSTFKRLIKLGFERIVLTTAAHANPALLEECTQRFGSSAVIAGIDYRMEEGRAMAYVNSGSVPTGKAVDRIRKRTRGPWCW